MLNRSRRLVLASKMGLAGAIMLTTLALSLGSDVPSSSAAGSSAFCKTLVSFVPILEKHEAPKTNTPAGFHAWAEVLLPYYKELAAESSGKSKVVSADLTTLFTYYEHATSLATIESYEKANHAKFEANTKAFAAAIGACY